MDIYQQQSMQNWKKQIIMDPHLNSLFDNSVSPSEFVNKILALPHEQIMKIYMKLTSLKHSISKNMQKEIEAKYPIIEHAFSQNYQTKNNFQSINCETIKNYLKIVQKFNEKYELIAEKVTESKNLNKILHFAKALQKLKVNIRLLRSLMKDFDQNINSKLLDELVNSLKISKILKEISALTIKFDFTGIRSFQEERPFINNTKGAIFGLIEKELTQILQQLPHKLSKREQLEKDITNKLNVLININKLKDFRSIFYRNNLRQMSQLCKKCLNIGQSEDEKDVKNHILVFEEYFSNSLHKKMIELSIIFIVFEQIIEKNNIKTTVNANFFEKYWQNLMEFIRDLLNWSIQNDPKQWARDKISQNLYQAFTTLETKSKINRYLTSIVWKYPVVYEQLALVSNQAHLFLIKNAKYHHYDFSILKERMIRQLIPLSHLYYKHSTMFYEAWKNQIKKYQQNIQGNVVANENYPLNALPFLTEDKSKPQESHQIYFKILDWLLFNVRTQEIFQFHIDCILSIIDKYFEIFKAVVDNYDEQRHSTQNYASFNTKIKNLLMRFKTTLRRSSQEYSSLEYVPNLQKDNTKQLISSSEKLVLMIKIFRRYQQFIKKNEEKFGSPESQ